MRVWQPSDVWEFPTATAAVRRIARLRAVRTAVAATRSRHPRADVARAWMPWLFLSIAVILWGLAPVKAFLNGGPQGLAAYRAGGRPYVSRMLSPTWNVPLLHRAVFRDYPVVPAPVDRARIHDPAYRNERAEAAVFTFNWAVGDRHGDSARGARDGALPARLARRVLSRRGRRRCGACARRSPPSC